MAAAEEVAAAAAAAGSDEVLRAAKKAKRQRKEEKLGKVCVCPKRCTIQKSCVCTDEDRCKAVYHGHMEEPASLDNFLELKAKVMYAGHVAPKPGEICAPHRAQYIEGVIRSGKTTIECFSPLLSKWDEAFEAQNIHLKTDKRFAILAPNKCLVDNFLNEGLGLGCDAETDDEIAEALAAIKTKTIHTIFKVPAEAVLAYNKTVFVMSGKQTGKQMVTHYETRDTLAKARVVVGTIGKFLSALKEDRKKAAPLRVLGPRSIGVFILDEAHKGMQYPRSPFESEAKQKDLGDKATGEWKTLYTAFPCAAVFKCSGSRSDADLKMETAARSTFSEVYEARRVVTPKLVTLSHGGLERASGVGHLCCYFFNSSKNQV